MKIYGTNYGWSDHSANEGDARCFGTNSGPLIGKKDKA